MSTTYKGLAVAFKKDLPEDCVKRLTDAIKLLDGIADVQMVEHGPNDYHVELRIRMDIIDKMYLFMKEIKG